MRSNSPFLKAFESSDSNKRKNNGYDSMNEFEKRLKLNKNYKLIPNKNFKNDNSKLLK